MRLKKERLVYETRSLFLANLSSCVCRAEILLEPLFSFSLWARNSKSIRVLGLRVAHTRSKKKPAEKLKFVRGTLFAERCERGGGSLRTHHLGIMATAAAPRDAFCNIFAFCVCVQRHFEHTSARLAHLHTKRERPCYTLAPLSFTQAEDLILL